MYKHKHTHTHTYDAFAELLTSVTPARQPNSSCRIRPPLETLAQFSNLSVLKVSEFGVVFVRSSQHLQHKNLPPPPSPGPGFLGCGTDPTHVLLRTCPASCADSPETRMYSTSLARFRPLPPPLQPLLPPLSSRFAHCSLKRPH